MSIVRYLERVTPTTYLDSQSAYQLLSDPDVDLDALREAAHRVNVAINGNCVTYIVNRNLNFTNVCSLGCSFCGFSRSKGSGEDSTYSPDEVVERLALTPNVSEVCMQGGINPDLDYAYYRNLIRGVHEAFPHIHIHAFSPQEIHYMTLLSGLMADEVLGDLMECGLGSIAGTAAEILDDRLRSAICPNKIRSSRWEEIIRAAHKLGMRFPATIMFGHIETPREHVAHLEFVRRIQRETGGFTEFIPLPFVPYRTRLGREHHIAEMISMDYLKHFYAVCRLFFGDLIGNLQVSWVKLGIENAMTLLDWGASDFGGTLYEENITRTAGGRHGVRLSVEQIRAAIERAGRRPVRRDTQYHLYDTAEPEPCDSFACAAPSANSIRRAAKTDAGQWEG
jgi:FO synthase